MVVTEELKKDPQKSVRWGLDNPHPLSQMRTELIWEGKYDEYGNRREVDIAGCAMPMQKIETVDEPADRLKQLGLFDDRKAYPDDFRNRLIWGDNKLVMASLLEEFKGQIKLIYIDPPFDVGADFTMSIPIGDKREEVEKDQSLIEMIAYRDIWGKGSDSYLQMLFERLNLLKELLSDDGSIYVHLGWQVDNLVKSILDEVFGGFNLRSQIIWKRTTAHTDAKTFGNIHETIFFYSKSESFTFNNMFVPFEAGYIKEKYKHVESDGRRYTDSDLSGAGSGPTLNFGDKGLISPPPGRHWMYDQDGINKLIKDHGIFWTNKGTPRLKTYYDGNQGVAIGSVWTDVFPINSQANERLGYSTQKPEALLDRIIQSSSNEGDLVADFFCGSGTTLAVAEKLGRRWIGADLGRFAIHTSRKRMIEIQRERHKANEAYRPFDVYNLGRYERQWWQQERLQGADEEHRKVVLGFYKAEVLANSVSPLLHGKKGRAFVHVDSIDSLLTRDELDAVAEACHAAGGKELHCLAWEFEMDLKQEALKLEKDYDLQSIRLIPIPREIMEKNRKEPPPFLEMAELEAESVIQKEDGKKVVEIKLTRFTPSLAEVPSKELEALRERAIQSGFDFIDFWAVDFDYHPDMPFYHHWQTYRTRKNRKLPTLSDRKFTYEKPGKYTVCVKVIDVFGCDTTTLLEVTV
ncbi:MAG: DNA methyltransferase [Oligoflexales bacterium]